MMFKSMNIEEISISSTNYHLSQLIEDVGSDSDGKINKLRLKLNAKNVIFRKWTNIEVQNIEFEVEPKLRGNIVFTDSMPLGKVYLKNVGIKNKITFKFVDVVDLHIENF